MTRETNKVCAKSERLKREKYSELSRSNFFEPVAVETSGTIGPESLQFWGDQSNRMAGVTEEPDSFQYLLQRLSIAIQRDNTTPILGTMKMWNDFTEYE